jgi:hypothetical protein
MDALLVAKKSLQLLTILKGEEFNLKPDITIAVLQTAAATLENVIQGEVISTIMLQTLKGAIK